jgi:hypothetical protein
MISDATQRSVFRWIHIIFAIPLIGYVCSPFEQIPNYAHAVRLFFRSRNCRLGTLDVERLFRSTPLFSERNEVSASCASEPCILAHPRPFREVNKGMKKFYIKRSTSLNVPNGTLAFSLHPLAFPHFSPCHRAKSSLLVWPPI